MGFVKLDSGILESTLWGEPWSRIVFITSLLMAVPIEIQEPVEGLNLLNAERIGYRVPPGWYGFAASSGVGIVRRSIVPNDLGMEALGRLLMPEAESRTPDHEGRRMARIPGGFLILNFQVYRDRDYTAAARVSRWRKRQKEAKLGNAGTRNITQAEAEAEAEAEMDRSMDVSGSALFQKGGATAPANARGRS